MIFMYLHILVNTFSNLVPHISQTILQKRKYQLQREF